MLLIFIAIAILPLGRMAMAQPDSVWARDYYFHGYSSCNDLLTDGSGTYYLLGSGEGRNKCYVISTDSTGEMIWGSEYGGDGNGQGFAKGHMLDSGCFIAVGEFKGHFNDEFIDWKPYVAIIDSSGELLWENIVTESLELGGLVGVCMTRDDGFIVVGYSINEGDPDMLVVLFDQERNILWQESFGDDEDDEYCKSTYQTEDGGFMLAGHSYRNGEADIIVLKIDADGNSQWTKYFGNDQIETAPTIIQLADSGFIMQGTRRNDDGYDDILIYRADPEGNEVWSQTYGGDSYDKGIRMIMTPDSGFVISGWYGPNRGGNRAFIMRVDQDGEEVWFKDFWPGLHSVNVFRGIVRTPDGGYAVAGDQGSYWWLYKTGPDPIQPNRAPGAFELVAPEENFTVDTPDSALLFDWTAAADPDSDAVHYVLYLQHRHPDSTRFQIDAHHSTSAREEIAVIMHITRLWPRFADTTVVFSWWVEASDGALTTPSLTRRTLFVPPPEGILDFGLRILDFGLGQPYPNPFNESVAVSFVLPFSSPVRLRVIDAGGREAAVLSEGFHSRGRYQLLWNARGLPAGTYLLRLDSRLARASRVVTLVK